MRKYTYAEQKLIQDLVSLSKLDISDESRDINLDKFKVGNLLISYLGYDLIVYLKISNAFACLKKSDNAVKANYVIVKIMEFLFLLDDLKRDNLIIMEDLRNHGDEATGNVFFCKGDEQLKSDDVVRMLCELPGVKLDLEQLPVQINAKVLSSYVFISPAINAYIDAGFKSIEEIQFEESMKAEKERHARQMKWAQLSFIVACLALVAAIILPFLTPSSNKSCKYCDVIENNPASNSSTMNLNPATDKTVSN